MNAVSSGACRPTEPKECLFKVLVIGDIGTGKTSIIKRYVHNFFSQHYKSTIGVDFALKVLNWDASTILRMQLWDIAGQERFGNMTRVYYKEAAGALVVFDATRGATLEGAARWKADLDTKCALADGRPIPAVLLANKCDLEDEGTAASGSELDAFCERNGFLSWYKTSAKENIGIDDAAAYLASNILYVKQTGQYEVPAIDKDSVRLLAPGTQAQRADGADYVYGRDGRRKKKCCAR